MGGKRVFVDDADNSEIGQRKAGERAGAVSGGRCGPTHWQHVCLTTGKARRPTRADCRRTTHGVLTKAQLRVARMPHCVSRLSALLPADLDLRSRAAGSGLQGRLSPSSQAYHCISRRCGIKLGRIEGRLPNLRRVTRNAVATTGAADLPRTSPACPCSAAIVILHGDRV
jgi:hypothetical protein